MEKISRDEKELLTHESMDRCQFVADIMQILIDHPNFDVPANKDLKDVLICAQYDVLNVYGEIMNRYPGCES